MLNDFFDQCNCKTGVYKFFVILFSLFIVQLLVVNMNEQAERKENPKRAELEQRIA